MQEISSHLTVSSTVVMENIYKTTLYIQQYSVKSSSLYFSNTYLKQ